MKNGFVKKALLAAAITGTLLGGVGLVSAQSTNTPTTPVTRQTLSATISLYATDPADGAEALKTVDLDRAGLLPGALQALVDTTPEAGFAVLEIGDWSRTVDLAVEDISNLGLARAGLGMMDGRSFGRQFEPHQDRGRVAPGRGFPGGNFGPRQGFRADMDAPLAMFGRGLAEGTSVEANFYSANPDEGGELLETINFVVGETDDTELQTQLRNATQEAAYVVVNIGEQSRSIDLNAFGGHPFFGGRR